MRRRDSVGKTVFVLSPKKERILLKEVVDLDSLGAGVFDREFEFEVAQLF